MDASDFDEVAIEAAQAGNTATHRARSSSPIDHAADIGDNDIAGCRGRRRLAQAPLEMPKVGCVRYRSMLRRTPDGPKPFDIDLSQPARSNHLRPRFSPFWGRCSLDRLTEACTLGLGTG